MSHFAKVIDGVVTEVIVSEKDFINSGTVGDEFLWVQTSYSGSFRGKFASTGDTYDKVNDKFIIARPYDSWELNTELVWEAPKTYPTDGKEYTWSDSASTWELIPFIEPPFPLAE
jgi:hypothetical protein